MAADNYVRIFDTTLRDGEQSPGASMTSAEKLEVARALGRLGVDVIEAGFPAASPDDLAAVAQIARTVGTDRENTPYGRPPSICGLARSRKPDIDKAWEAVSPSARPRIHIFLATSDIHMEHKLKMTRDEVLKTAREMVGYARGLGCEDIEFSPEDAGRSDPDFLYQVLGAVIEAGATTLNIPDTVGYRSPAEYQELIAGIRDNTAGIGACVISTHCHNDLGLATANSLAAVEAGARQVEVAVNGIGERAGNTSLEEVVMTLHTRRDHYGLETGIDTTQIMHASKLVSNVTGIPVQPNKAVVGANAFAHEAGIHQDGMLKNQQTYEIMRPETVGAGKTRLVLGKHSGRHAVKSRLAEIGYPLEGEELDRAMERFKELADRKKGITDADLEAVVSEQLLRPEEVYHLDGLQVACGTIGMPTATVRISGPDDERLVRASVGTGPVDAALKAIRESLGIEAPLLEYTVHSVTSGIDALGEVTVRVDGQANGALHPQSEADTPRTYVGHGADTDIVVASAKAYLSALNKIMLSRRAARQSDSAAPSGEAASERVRI